jgi:hypothetical protein
VIEVVERRQEEAGELLISSYSSWKK